MNIKGEMRNKDERIQELLERISKLKQEIRDFKDLIEGAKRIAFDVSENGQYMGNGDCSLRSIYQQGATEVYDSLCEYFNTGTNHIGEVNEMKNAFNTGYVIACCNAMNLHGDSVISFDTLAQLGISRDEVAAMYLTEYDLDALKEIEEAQSSSPYADDPVPQVSE